MSLSGYEQKHLWLGDGTGRFTDVAQAVGVTDTHDGRSVALADLWNTGALDVIVANQHGPLLIYRNTVSAGQQMGGARPARDALQPRAPSAPRCGCSGRTPRAMSASRCRRSWPPAASAPRTTTASTSAWGRARQIEKALIRWPSGLTQTLPLRDLDEQLQVTEPQ